MGTFGENLRREREMRGVTLEEISDATKISVRALKAVEADQFEKLPGGIFTRSFIRAYAKYLGLDEERIMAEFQLVAPPSAQQADLRKISQQRTPPPENKSRAGWVALVVGLLALAGGFAYYRFVFQAKKPLPAPAQTASQQPPAHAANSTPSQPRAATGSTEASSSGPAPEGGVAGVQGASEGGPPPAGAESTSAAAPEDGLVLQVAATEQTWVAVSIDGKSSFQHTMEPNQIETFRANKSFDVLTGNAEGIVLTLNGKTLDPLGRRGETKKVHLTLADAQNSNP
jgi:cytoskeleton protein RodZ